MSGPLLFMKYCICDKYCEVGWIISGRAECSTFEGKDFASALILACHVQPCVRPVSTRRYLDCGSCVGERRRTAFKTSTVDKIESRVASDSSVTLQNELVYRTGKSRFTHFIFSFATEW